MKRWIVTRRNTLDSTQAEARRRCAAGLSAKTAILADCQTAGRGRGNRAWESAAGKGLWLSLILPVAAPLETLAQSTLVLAAAVREAAERASGVDLRIKWPNDLLHDGRKCCGLLAEADAQANMRAPGMPAPVSLILGIGLNVNHLEDDFPESLRQTATSLRIVSGQECSRERILRHVLRSADRWFGLWTKKGFEPVRAAWLAANCTLGKRIVLPCGYGYAQGTARDLAPDGALVVLADDGALVRVDAGEIGL